MLLFMMFGLALMAISLGLLIGFNRMLLLQELSERAAESAALVAAVDLGKIVVNDPNYGYIALSDQPPTGQATLSADGHQQPVQGINTILGSARLQLLIAKESGDLELINVAEQDVQAANCAARSLSSALQFALLGDNPRPLRDRDGNQVKPFDDARQIYLDNLGRAVGYNPALTDFQLSLGWLDCNSGTGVPVPSPDSLAQVPETAKRLGEYKAYVNIPVGTCDFYFAGLGHQAALVDSRHFMAADGRRICSTVRVETNLEVKDVARKGDVQNWLPGDFTLCSMACAQPAAGEDAPAPGVLTISFPDGYVSSIDCISALITNADLRQTNAQSYRAQGGDYPYDKQTSIVEEDGNTSSSTARVFARGLHDWLRTAHCHVRIDSVLACLNLPFNQLPADQEDKTNGDATVTDIVSPKNLFCFECLPDGYIRATRKYCDVYQYEVVTENQEFALSCVNLESCPVSLSCHDYVCRLGTIFGGKHAGRAMPSGKCFQANEPSRYDYPLVQSQHTSDNSSSLILGQETRQPVQSWKVDPYHSGGLAVSFEVTNSSSAPTQATQYQ